MGESDISSIDHLVMREFVSGPPRYHLAIKGVREQFVAVEQNSGPLNFRIRFLGPLPHIFFRSTFERILFLDRSSRAVQEQEHDEVRVYRC